MVASNLPIYCDTPDVSTNGTTGMSQGVTSAAADYDGTSANYVLVFTAGADGGFLERIRCKAKGTNVAAVGRVFVNNGSTPGTASNNAFYDEITLPATTAATTTATATIDAPMNLRLPAGFRVYVGLGAAVAAGWVFMGVGGQY